MTSPGPGAVDSAEGTAGRPQWRWRPHASRSVLGAWPEIAVVSSFVATRLAYRVGFDIHFDTSPLYYFLQYLDPWFVDHDFLRSVLYLHHQAPLQILVAQGAMKVLGLVQGARAREAIYAALGLSVALALTRIFVRLGVPRPVAVVAVVLYTSSPTFVLYENWLFYPMPTAALLVLATLAIVRFYGAGTFGSALVFFSLLGAVGLLRSTFGSVFVAAAVNCALASAYSAGFQRPCRSPVYCTSSAAMPVNCGATNEVPPAAPNALSDEQFDVEDCESQLTIAWLHTPFEPNNEISGIARLVAEALSPVIPLCHVGSA